jgi:hypothetical protein
MPSEPGSIALANLAEVFSVHPANDAATSLKPVLDVDGVAGAVEVPVE